METLEMKHLFNSIYQNKTVLITGDTGFKGSWLSLWLMQMGATVIGYSVDDGTKTAHHKLLKQKYKSYRGDVNDLKRISSVIKKHNPQIVFHLAAQSLVLESYSNPVETYRTNVMGTLNILEAARASGSVKAIVNVTTDKVYENKEIKKTYKETDVLGGFDMYSSSKACVEILSASYKRAFFGNNGILLATVRAGNVIGGGDWGENRLIPDLVKAASKKKRVLIRNPKSVRPWQFVLEPLSGYLLLGQRLLEGKKEYADAWNFGPNKKDCLSVIEILILMKKGWGKISPILADRKTGEHEAAILMLDHSKAQRHLKWQPVWGIGKAVMRTSAWYKAFYTSGTLLSSANLIEYIADAKHKKIIWTR
jgi:CDP-glucose 4,6-dehydratase